jgi:hypothetical protein
LAFLGVLGKHPNALSFYAQFNHLRLDAFAPLRRETGHDLVERSSHQTQLAAETAA